VRGSPEGWFESPGGATSYPITFMWTVPRTVSTSFERMMSARGDHTVFDEPFSRSYYFGPDRRSSRYTESMPDSSAPSFSLATARIALPVSVHRMMSHSASATTMTTAKAMTRGTARKAEPTSMTLNA